MRNGVVFALFTAVVGAAILIGAVGERAPTPLPHPQTDSTVPGTATPALSGVPSVGSVQVLNGCGAPNAGSAVADFLRSRGFDVKNVDNAPSWNYPYTIVASRSTDSRNATGVARALRTDKLITLRTGESLYDVVVYIGPDFRELVQ